MQYVTLTFPTWKRQAEIMGYTVEDSGTRFWALSKNGQEMGAYGAGIGWLEHPPAPIWQRIERGV